MRIQKEDPDVPGTLYDRQAHFDSRPAGALRDPDSDRVVYDLATNGGLPMITNLETGRTYVLSWPDIITMAQRAGIDTKKRGTPE